MKTLSVRLTGHTYDILIGGGVLQEAGERIAAVHTGRRAFVLTDDNVWGLYGNRLQAALSGWEWQALVLPHGEHTKSIENYQQTLCRMAQAGLTRSDLLIAFGGGVIGDLGGFAAATYMRGIRFVQIPTTLLAQVDSAVGGKTAVNLPNGKNLVGAFHQPTLVLSDPALLHTLPAREQAGGMAEVIKYGAIYSAPLFQTLEEHPSFAQAASLLDEIVYTCCDLKRAVVERDEKDTGERMLLNFGHTFGHAIEQLGEYERFIHGEGVALGMVLAARAGECLGVTPAGTADRLRRLCGAFGLPVSCPYTASQLQPLMALDKKAVGSEIRLVLLRKIGSAFVKSLEPAAFDRLMGELERAD